MLIQHAGRIVGHAGGIVGYEPVAPVPNAAPVAVFTATPDGLMVRVDGGASTDPDGAVVAYAWAWGDGTTTNIGPTSAHTYAQPDSYTVTLTVTDDDGATAQASQTVTVAVENLPPVAAFTVSTNQLTVQVDAGGSSDTDGTITNYAWSFGDGVTATGMMASHAYTEAGDYTVTLTVTDDDGATSTTSRVVTVVAAILPTPVLTSISEPVPGAVRIDWTAVTGATEYRVYETNSATTGPADVVLPPATSRQSGAIWQPGEEPDYWITYVKDGVESPPSNVLSITIAGAVTDEPADVARDSFTRTLASGWGTADIGGAWTATAAKTSTDGTAGVMSLSGANDAAGARLPGATGVDLATEITTSLSARPNGSGAFGLIRTRITPTGDEYRFKYQLASSGAITAWWTKSIAGTETVISPVVTVPVTYDAGTRLRIKAAAISASPTSLLSKMWIEGTAEPAVWLHDLDDSTAQLQEPGHVGVYTQLSGGTTVPVTVRWDDLLVASWGAGEQPDEPLPDEPEEPTDPPPEPPTNLIRYINYDDPALSATSYGPLVGASQTYDLADAVYVVETPRNPAPWETGTPVPQRMVVVRGADVAGTGAYKPTSAARFEVRRNDEYASVMGDGSLYRTSRSEYRENHRDVHPAGEERWYDWRYLIPTGFQAGGTAGRDGKLWFILTQFKTAGGSPPLDIEINRERLRLGGTVGGARTIADITRGTWGRLTVGVVPHTDPSIGWVEVRHNGTVVIPKTYMVTTKTESGVPAGWYLKQGIYRQSGWETAPNDDGSTGVDHVIQLGSVRIGPTLASVTA